MSSSSPTRRRRPLILENTLIKKYKPPFNARLKDDKTYPFLKIDLAEEFPQIYITRRVKK